MSKKLIIACMSVCLSLCGAAALAPVVIGADGICADVPDAPGCNTGNAQDEFQTQIQVMINVILGVAGLIAVGFIIFGGFKYTTSAGDAAKVTSAKNTILYAVIGLVVAGLAFAIVNFVIRGLRF